MKGWRAPIFGTDKVTKFEFPQALFRYFTLPTFTLPSVESIIILIMMLLLLEIKLHQALLLKYLLLIIRTIIVTPP